MRHLPLLAVNALALTLLAGCAGDNRDLEQWVQEMRQRPPAPIEPIPEIETPEPVVYDAYELRDPFMRPEPDAPEQAGTGAGPRPDPDRRREYLERFPLDALDMVGTITLGDRNFGLVEDVEGTIHRVREGNYLGQNHGRILQVTPTAIEVMELVPDGAGGWMEREARIALSEQDRQG
ncbi:MAG: pilus assembly protein PilP [Candidatus Wenzhouxiangella sp. M2_3B_020]